ncbi:Protein FAR1-RELATED SEQUENCE 1 [Bienertia sinuspersici]
MQEKEADEKGHKYTLNFLTGIPLEKYSNRIMYGTRKGGIHEYLTPKRRMYNCVHNIEEKEIQCGCKMFETHGILCRHVIRVLDMNLYEEPPEKYVLRRWGKDIRRKHALVEVCYHDPTKTETTKRFDKMNAVSNTLAFESCGCQQTCDIVLNGLKRISDEVRAYNVAHAEEVGGKTLSVTSHREQTHAPCPPTDNASADVAGQSKALQRSVGHDIIPESGSGQCGATAVCGDPHVLKRKGRPKGSRYKSPGEKGWKKANQSASKKGVSGGKRKSQV